jgi:hypothetical protein
MNRKIKHIILLIQLFSLFSLQAKENDEWLNIGYEYAHDYHSETNDSDKDTQHTESRGITLSFYRFKKDRNIGLFLHTSLLAPRKNEDFDYTKADAATAGSYIIGPGFKGPEYYNMIQPYGGIGLHYLQFTYHDTLKNEEESYSCYQLTNKLGIGGEMGCRLNFHPNFFLGLGTILAWDFYSSSLIGIDDKEGTFHKPDKFHSFMISPFITLGYARVNRE